MRYATTEAERLMTAGLDELHDAAALVDAAARFFTECADGSQVSDRALRCLLMARDKIAAAIGAADTQ